MFLKQTSGNGTLMSVFQAFPKPSIPLIEYHEALLRGPSPFTVAERELIAAYMSGVNACGYCHGIHTATGEQFGVPEGLLVALLEDVEQASIDEKMKPVLRYVEKLTKTPHRMSPEDVEAVFAAGWSDQALHDAVSVCALFNMMNRIVDGLGVTADAAYTKLSAERLAEKSYQTLADMLRAENETL